MEKLEEYNYVKDYKNYKGHKVYIGYKSKHKAYKGYKSKYKSHKAYKGYKNPYKGYVAYPTMRKEYQMGSMAETAKKLKGQLDKVTESNAYYSREVTVRFAFDPSTSGATTVQVLEYLSDYYEVDFYQPTRSEIYCERVLIAAAQSMMEEVPELAMEEFNARVISCSIKY